MYSRFLFTFHMSGFSAFQNLYSSTSYDINGMMSTITGAAVTNIYPRFRLTVVVANYRNHNWYTTPIVYTYK